MKSPSPNGEGESRPRCKDQPLYRSALGPAPHRGLAGPAAVDIAGIVEAHSFGRRDLGIGCRNEGRHRAVLGAADADTGLEAGIVGLGRLIVRHVDHVVLVDGDVARPAELLPFGDELSVRIENLDAAVAAVGHENPPLGIHRDAMQRIELALTLAVLAEGQELLAGLVELDDAVIGVPAMAVADKNVAVAPNHDAACAVEVALGVAGHALMAERHQHLARGAELDDDAALAVPDLIVRPPHTAFIVDKEAVRRNEHVGAEAPHELAGLIELLDRVAVRLLAAVEHPNALAVAVVDLDLDGPAELAARRELKKVILHLV